MDYEPDASVNVAVGSISAVCGIITVLGYLWIAWRYRQNYWHHAVRLPSVPDRHHWYQVTVSIGCRPWAGHEGDIYLHLVGHKGQGKAFLVNNEVHSRLHEAEAQIFLFSSHRSLGDIKYVIMVCGATQRKKRFFLSSIQIKHISNDAGREQYWYFPYHEWIEVFLNPVKVTLCGVDPHHDINRRLLMGWLSRGVSDFHLWLSILGPLKYTRFRRSERFLCSGAHAAGSILCCVYLNGWIPNLGRVVLGLFSSASVAVPVYLMEWCLRMTNRQPKVIVEDVQWYRGKTSRGLKNAVSYSLFRTVASENCDVGKIACSRKNENAEIRQKEFEAYRGIMANDSVFWRWLTDGGRMEATSFLSLDAESYVTADERLPLLARIRKNCFKCRAILGVLRDWLLGKTGRGPYADVMRVEEGRVTPYEARPNIIAEMIKAAKAASQQAVNIKAPPPAPPKLEEHKQTPWEKKWVDLNQDNFFGDPTLLWRVNSEFSIFSLEMEGVDFDQFSLIESMPVADFDLLRQGKRPLMGWLDEADSQYWDASGHGVHIENHVYRKLVPKVKPIYLPPSIKNLSYEEGQLVCMIYFDLVTKGYQWCNPDVPDELFDHEDTSIRPATDWMKLDIASKQDLLGKWKPRDFKGRGKENINRRMTLAQMRQKYPEPIPRQRVFSMLIFPEYARKLADAYDGMLEIPEMYSCLAEMFAMFAESHEGPLMFGEACLQLSQSESGRRAICHLLSAARKSPAWANMILDLAQRLRFQGDNIKRIKAKYGLQASCNIKTAAGEIPYEVKCFENACLDDCKPLQFDKNGNLICDTKVKNKCLYYEMDRMTAWNQKLTELNIPKKECPMGQLPQSDITKLSRFFRAMVLSEDGCVMFSELILQINAGGREGSDSIARVLRFVTSADDGVKRLIGFHRELGESGKIGRRLLLRWYNAVKRQPPHGYKILERLADALSDVPLGRMLIEDLQVDGKKAQVIARKIRSEIHQHLDSFVKSTARSLKHTILRLNEMARNLLSACDHAKSVLNGEGELPFKKQMETRFTDSVEHLEDAAAMENGGQNEATPWRSKITCCRNYKELVAKLNAENRKTPPPKEKSDNFKWSSDEVSLSCIYANTPEESNKLVSQRWVPMDDREKINIYQRESPSAKLLRERLLKIEAGKNKAAKKKRGDCVGLNAPCCKRMDYCLAREREIYNQFYLQTKDYEKFYINFSFRPTGFRQRLDDIEGRLGGDGAFSIRSKSSLAWEANKEGYHQNPLYFGRNRQWDEIESAAAKWGRKVVYEDDESKQEPVVQDDHSTIKPCVCTHGKCIYTCLVCSIARQTTETKDPRKRVSIVKDQTGDVPRVSTSDLQPFPEYEDVVLAKPIRPSEIEHGGLARQKFKEALDREKEETLDNRDDVIKEKRTKNLQSGFGSKAPSTDHSSWKVNMKHGIQFQKPNPSAKTPHVSEYLITDAQDLKLREGKLHIPPPSSTSSIESSASSAQIISLTDDENEDIDETAAAADTTRTKDGRHKLESVYPICCHNKYKKCRNASEESLGEKLDEETEKDIENPTTKTSLILPLGCKLNIPPCPCYIDEDKERHKQMLKRNDEARHAEQARKERNGQVEDDGERHCPRIPSPSAGYYAKRSVAGVKNSAESVFQCERYSVISEIANDNDSARWTDASVISRNNKIPLPSAGCCRNKHEIACPCVDDKGRPKPKRRHMIEGKRLQAMYTKQEADHPDPDQDNLIKLQSTGCGKNCIGKLAKAPGRPYPITAKNFKLVESTKNPISATARKALDLMKERDLNEFNKDDNYVKPKNAGIEYLDGDLLSESDGWSDATKMMEEIEYCQVCGGVASLKRVKDLNYALRYRIPRQGDDSSPAESMSDITFPSDVDDPKIIWKQALGCCRRPACRAVLPKGAQFRRIPQRESDEREKRYWENKKALEKEVFNKFQQWLPPGRHIVPCVKNKEVLEFAPDIDGAYHSDSYVTAVSCFRGDDSSASNSINSMDKLVRSVSKKPVISRKAKLMKFRQFLNDTCDLHKLPRFACCRLHDSKWMTRGKKEAGEGPEEEDYMKNFADPPLSCICNTKPTAASKDFSNDETQDDDHSICSECHIRIGTQQKPQPPCSRYLLPLKAVRCYEEAIRAHKEQKAENMKNRPDINGSDSGLDTAIDVIHSEDANALNYIQNQTLLDLMGLSKRPGPRIKVMAGHVSPASSYISLNSTVQSSGVCCHVNTARRLPILHLQGYGCDPATKFPFSESFQPLSIEWWKRHDVALNFVQDCADECVRFRVLVARSREEALTEHEKTCKVCIPRSDITFNIDFDDLDSPHDDDGIEMIGGTVIGARYSEMLPVVWRPKVREDGLSNEPLQIEKRRVRFYRQLIQAVVESTRMLILTPDIVAPRAQSKISLNQRHFRDFLSSDTTDAEADKTSAHVIRLSHYRAMIKSFNDLLKTVNKIKNEKIVKPDDINQACKIVLNEGSTKKCLELCSQYNPEDNRIPLTIVDALTEYMKGKMCGSVEDCREVLSFPWDIPLKQQHVAGRFLSGIMDRMTGEDETFDVESLTKDDALEAVIESYIGEAIFKATTQLHIQKAVEHAGKAKQYLAYLNCITKMCVAKLVRYGSVIENAIGNTTKVVKSCLEAVDTKVREREFKEPWWKDTEKEGSDLRDTERHYQSLLHFGRDDNKSTLDDVIIGFERLRRYVRYDLQLAQQEILSIAALQDVEAMRLYHGVSEEEIPERKGLTAYDAWTESEMILREKRRSQTDKPKKEPKVKTGSDENMRAKFAPREEALKKEGLTDGASTASGSVQLAYCSTNTSQTSFAKREEAESASYPFPYNTPNESVVISGSHENILSHSAPPPGFELTSTSEKESGKSSFFQRWLPGKLGFGTGATTNRQSDTSGRLHLTESEIIPTKMYWKDGYRVKDTSNQPPDGILKKDSGKSQKRDGYHSDDELLRNRIEQDKQDVTANDKILETIVLRDENLKIAQIITRDPPYIENRTGKSNAGTKSLLPSANPAPDKSESVDFPIQVEHLLPTVNSCKSGCIHSDTITDNSEASLTVDLSRECDVTFKGNDFLNVDKTTSNRVINNKSYDNIPQNEAGSPEAMSFVSCSSRRGSLSDSGELKALKPTPVALQQPLSSLDAVIVDKPTQANWDEKPEKHLSIESVRDDSFQNSNAFNKACSKSSSAAEVSLEENNTLKKLPERVEKTLDVKKAIEKMTALKRAMEEKESESIPVGTSASEIDLPKVTSKQKIRNMVSKTDSFIDVLMSRDMPNIDAIKDITAVKPMPKFKKIIPTTRTISLSCSLKTTSSESSFSPNSLSNCSSASVPDLRERASTEHLFSKSGRTYTSRNNLHPSTGVTPYHKPKRSQKTKVNRLDIRAEKRKHAKRPHTHRWGSVFGFAQITSGEDFHTEGHTKKALQSEKGKNMLEEVFGKPLSPKELMDTYHHNIRNLIRNQNGQILPFWTSHVMQGLLFLLCFVAAGWTLILAFINESIDDNTLYAAVPIAIAAFGLILEPLKCLAIAWFLFLRGKRPAFFNSPLYVKSNPGIMIRNSALRPKKSAYINKKDMSSYDRMGMAAEDFEEGLYRQYCENRSRPNCERHQRRILPSLGESDVELDFENIPTFDEIEEAKFTPYIPKTSSTIVPEDDLPVESESGFRRGAFDIGNTESKSGFRRDAVDKGAKRVAQTERSAPHPDNKDTDKDPASPKDPSDKLSARIVWCNFANTGEVKEATKSKENTTDSK